MKIVKEQPVSIDAAREAEAENNLEVAAKMYEEVLKAEPLNETVSNRLMIIYRKLREYRKELKIINKGIRSFEAFYKSRLKHSSSKTIVKLSNALSLKTGLIDKKGNHIHDPEPIAKWKKRKSVVEGKIG